jgi:D-mannonate dehydratase
LKITVNDLRNKLIKSESEKNKMLEMSIIEKVELEEKIKKFEAKQNSDVEYVQEMEMQISKLR